MISEDCNDSPKKEGDTDDGHRGEIFKLCDCGCDLAPRSRTLWSAPIKFMRTLDENEDSLDKGKI